jgi:uncharacterized membrane protein
MVKSSPLRRGPAGKVSGAVFALSFFAVLATMACLKYLSLHTTVFDLGIYLSNLFAVSKGGEWWRAFNGHIQPLLPVFGVLCDMSSDSAAPFLLLIVQALFLALPIVLAAPRFGLMAAMAYALYFAVWFNALFDFHPDFLVVPSLFIFFLLADSGLIWAAFATALLPMLVKEPYALQTAACGIYLLCVSRRRLPGLLLALFGCLYFFAATRYAIPFFTADAGVGLEGGAFSWLGDGIGAMLGHIILHPLDTLGAVFGNAGKLKYLLGVFGALAFLSLVRPLALIVALPCLALSLLSSLPNYYSLANHYAAGLIAPLFYAFCKALGPSRDAFGRYGVPPVLFNLLLALILLAGHVMLSPSPISRLFWQGEAWGYHYSAYQPTARDAEIIKAIHEYVPEDPFIAVSVQNTLNWGAAARRLNYNSFPLGVERPHPVQFMTVDDLAGVRRFVATGEKPPMDIRSWKADYVLLDLKRPWFMVDTGCDWRGACNDRLVAAEFLAAMNKAKTIFNVIYQNDGFMILRRKAGK